MIKVFIVDDHKSVLDAFSSIIEGQADMCFVGSATSTASVPDLCRTLAPDVVLTDISVEDTSSGLVLTSKLRKLFPDLKIVVMSGFDEISYIPGAKEAGADAFLSKSRPMPEFIDMIRDVMRGDGSFPEPILIPTVQGQSPFTERELEVLRLLCQSYSRKEIADEMGIAIGTVKRHMENMLLKSGCKSAMELVVYVIGNGWISSK